MLRRLQFRIGFSKRAQKCDKIGLLLIGEPDVETLIIGLHHIPNVAAGDAGIVEGLQHCADVLVMVDHHFVVFALPTPGLAPALRLHMRAQMHCVKFTHRKEASRPGPDVVDSAVGNVVVDRYMRFSVSGPVSRMVCLPTLATATRSYCRAATRSP